MKNVIIALLVGIIVGQCSTAHADTSQISRRDLLTAAVICGSYANGGCWNAQDVAGRVNRVLTAVGP